MKNDIEDVLLSEAQIQVIVSRLGAKITNDYLGKELVVIGILKGANIFVADLIRKIDLPLTLDYMSVSSYGMSTESSGVVSIAKDLDHAVEGKDIIVVEDIIDTGLTLNYLTKNLASRGARSIAICTLLDKPSKRKAPIEVDYVGFEVPDAFVVGYGIDFAEKYRNLPYVATLKKEAQTI